MKFNFKNKKILITGGTGYLGKDLVKRLIKYDAKIILISRNKYIHKNVDFFKCDLNNSIDLKQILDRIKKKYNSIAGFVHMASSAKLGSFDKIDKNEFLNVFKINTISFVEIIKQLYPLFQRYYKSPQELCSVISVSSIYGNEIPNFEVYKKSIYQNPISYGSSKSSLIHTTKYLALEKKLRKIRFNSISPGSFPNKNIKFKSSINKKRLLNKISLGRFGEPKEFTDVVIFLLSQNSSYINGSNIFVDGGYN